MKKEKSICIIGGGLAGLTAAIHLVQAGSNSVFLIEKHAYPRHKVCGEYVSNEVLEYLNSLGIFPLEAGAKQITHFQFTGFSGQGLETQLPLGGFGISRYALDQLLVDRARSLGVIVVQDEVTETTFENDIFSVRTKGKRDFNCDYLLGAFGKRSGVDVTLARKFIQKKSPWLAVKAHYKADFPDHLVGLHHFKGGYCGLSKVESNHVNACYLADYKTFKKFKSLNVYQEQVLEKNDALKHFFKEATMVFEKPLTISQISFEKKTAVAAHILMIGDSAGLIHPLCGNGMAMAIHSAKMVSEQLIHHFKNQTSRKQLEAHYTQAWNQTFQTRMRNGALIQRGLQNKTITRVAVGLLKNTPLLLKQMIKTTHGTRL